MSNTPPIKEIFFSEKKKKNPWLQRNRAPHISPGHDNEPPLCGDSEEECGGARRFLVRNEGKWAERRTKMGADAAMTVMLSAEAGPRGPRGPGCICVMS